MTDQANEPAMPEKPKPVHPELKAVLDNLVHVYRTARAVNASADHHESVTKAAMAVETALAEWFPKKNEPAPEKEANAEESPQ